jgi:hypothetical protein
MRHVFLITPDAHLAETARSFTRPEMCFVVGCSPVQAKSMLATFRPTHIVVDGSEPCADELQGLVGPTVHVQRFDSGADALSSVRLIVIESYRRPRR